MDSGSGVCWQKAVIQAVKQRISQKIFAKLYRGINRYGQIRSGFLRYFLCVTICKYENDRHMCGLINGDSFIISSGCMEILIQEPKLKSIWYLPEMLASCTRYEVCSELRTGRRLTQPWSPQRTQSWNIFWKIKCKNFFGKNNVWEIQVVQLILTGRFWS